MANRADPLPQPLPDLKGVETNGWVAAAICESPSIKVGGGVGEGARYPEVVVAGYASIDRAFRASAPPAVDRTALLTGPVHPPPRLGGCGPTAARELARMRRRTGLVSWLGDDADGSAYRRTLAKEGIDLRGVTVAAGQASPHCYLFYDPAGGATCYYHPSGSAELRLSAGARAMLATARALVLTVCPAPLTQELIDARPADARLAWSVKADPDAYPVALRRRLVEQADLICVSRAELAFVAAALSNPPSASDPEEAVAALRREGRGVLVVTAGREGCRVVWEGGDVSVPAEPVTVADPTGAGDTFFGAFVAGWLAGDDLVVTARLATARTAAMLRERSREEMP